MNISRSTDPDPGYMGDRRRGASLGRPHVLCNPLVTENPVRLHLRKIRVDSQGYDPGGAYWGHGGWLYEAWDNGGQVYVTGRLDPQCDDYPAGMQRARERAKAEIRETFPHAQFYR